MNIPSAGEFITFIYPRVSNSYPCSSGRTDSPSNPPFSEFNLPDNETSRASSSPRDHLLKSPHPEASTSISLILDPFRSEGGRGKAAYGGGGVFGNPFAARYVAKSEDNGASERGAGEAGGNRRRVGWYKANRASQEDSFAPPFLPFASSSSSQFSTCSFHSTAGLPFKLLRAPGIVFSCLLILVLLFRVTLTTNLCSSVKILFASRPLSRPLSLSFTLSAVWNFAVSSSLSEPRSRYRTFVTLEWNSLFHAFHSTLIFWLYIYIYTWLVLSFFQDFFRGYYYFCNIINLLFIIFMSSMNESIIYLLREKVINFQIRFSERRKNLRQ